MPSYRWLGYTEENWDTNEEYSEHPIPSEERDLPLIALAAQPSCLPLIHKISKYIRLGPITPWIFTFVRNCRAIDDDSVKSSILTVEEIEHAKEFWCRVAQESTFLHEISSLKKKGKWRLSSQLLTLHPFSDTRGL